MSSTTPRAPASGRKRLDPDLLLSFPALLLVCAVALAPLLWLTVLSFLSDGQFTLENYTRLVTDESYRYIFWDTFRLALGVTAVTALLGYPTAYVLAHLRGWTATVMLIFVLLPFWTSVVVRAYAWLIILQRKGVVNSALVHAGLIESPLPILNNFTGVMIGMSHVLLPFMVLPLIASMKAIDPNLAKASLSLGASPARTFWRVFFPLSMPGFVAGALLVFVQALGYYIMPQVLGGGRIQTVAMKIKTNIDVYFDWGASSALAVTLIVATALLFFIVSVIRARAATGVISHAH